MPVGKSHRIVIEVDPDLKEQIYASLKAQGLTLKDWFIQQVQSELLNEESPTVSQNGKGGK